jgi:hypothetical protein
MPKQALREPEIAVLGAKTVILSIARAFPGDSNDA